ncbi:MAG TPA: DUF4126 domain-containing protein [Edaphobacter sp.]
MSFTPANITALIVAASFAAGLNIYATVLTLGILARTQWVPLPPGLDSLGHTWVLVACAIMFAIEFVVDKIPALDMAWNVLHTVVRVPIAGLVAYNASAHLSPQMQIMATTIGAVIALATHTSKTAVRAAVTPSPEPISNIALSTTEDAVAIGITWFATHHPIIAASAALIFLTAGILAARALLRAIRRPLQRILQPDTAQKPPA